MENLKSHRKITRFGIGGWLLILGLIFVVGLITWRVYDMRANQTTNNRDQMATETYTAKEYSFKYPKAWSISTENHEAEETITLKAPNTVTSEQSIGGYVTSKGAVIKLLVTECIDAQKCTVANAYEGEEALYTVFFKNGKKYIAIFTAEGDESSNPLLGDYNKILSSFKFR